MKVDCLRCGVPFEAREGQVTCIRCEQAVAGDADPEILDLADIVEDDEPPSHSQTAPADSGYVACPMCDEKIRKAAKVCRFCGERLDRADLFGVWRDGKRLVMSKNADLPYRCVKTNEPAETLLRRKLSWHSPLVFLSIFAGLLIYVVLALVTSKKADIRVPITHRIVNRRTLAIAAGWLSGLGGLTVIILACILLSDSQDPMWRSALPIIIIGGILFILVSAIVSAMIASIVRPTRITDSHVWLKGVHPDYLGDLPQWPGE